MHYTYVQLCLYIYIKKIFLCAKNNKILTDFFFKAFSTIILKNSSLKNFCESLYRIMLSGSKLKCIFLQTSGVEVYKNQLVNNIEFTIVYIFIDAIMQQKGSQVMSQTWSSICIRNFSYI